jgi:hypothetical protein
MLESARHGQRTITSVDAESSPLPKHMEASQPRPPTSTVAAEVTAATGVAATAAVEALTSGRRRISRAASQLWRAPPPLAETNSEPDPPSGLAGAAGGGGHGSDATARVAAGAAGARGADRASSADLARPPRGPPDDDDAPAPLAPAALPPAALPPAVLPGVCGVSKASEAPRESGGCDPNDDDGA